MKNRKSLTLIVIFVSLFLTFCSIFSIAFAEEVHQPVTTTNGPPPTHKTPVQHTENGLQNVNRASFESLSDLKEASLATGTYYIKNASNNYYIDIHGPSLFEGGLIHQWSFHPNLYENWIIESHSVSGEKYYSFKSPYSNMYIGIENQTENIANIKQYSTISNKTRWKILKNTSNRYVFVPQTQYQSAVVLSVPSATKGVELVQTSYTGLATQFWYLYHQEEVNTGVYYIQNAQTRRYADLYGPSTADGAAIQQWDLNRNNGTSISAWRKWEFELQDDLYYTIKNVYSGKYLGIDESTSPPTIKQYSSQTANNVRWKIYTIPNKTDPTSKKTKYTLTPKGYDYAPFSSVLSITTGENNLGTPLCLYPYVNNTDTRDEWMLFGDMQYVGTVSEWNSDSTTVAYWNQNVVFNHRILGTTENDMSGAFSSALNQWDSALPITLSTTDQQTQATIVCYSGTVDAITDTFEAENRMPNNPSVAGMTIASSTTEAFISFQNEIKYLKRMTFAYLYVYDRTAVISIMIHEMGHALGYQGHSTNSFHIMREEESNIVTLSDPEKNHLSQAYSFDRS